MTIEIRVLGADDVDLVLSAQTLLAGRAVRFEVCDAGDGISSALVQEALKPFFTTKSRGTGLGLPIASGIAQAHGGVLRVENTPEGGVRAAIEIPRDRLPATRGD
jgi:signal transduction histidine kinase